MRALFSEISGSLCDLDETDRAELAELTRRRIELLRLEMKLCELRLVVLHQPTRANEEKVKQFSETVLTPARREYGRLVRRTVHGSIDVDGIKETLPMLVLALARHVKLPVLLTASGFNPEAIDEVVEVISTFIKKGLG